MDLQFNGSGPLNASAEAEILIARVFDLVDPKTGAAFDPDHPRVDDPADRRGLLGYLRAGAIVKYAAERSHDVMRGKRQRVVPASFRTDGFWIWTDEVAYYLERYHLAPDPALADHIRGFGYTMPNLTEEAAYRALSMVRRPAV